MSAISNTHLWVWGDLTSQQPTDSEAYKKFCAYYSDPLSDKIQAFAGNFCFFYCGCDENKNYGWGSRWRCIQMIASHFSEVPPFSELLNSLGTLKCEGEGPGYGREYLNRKRISNQLALYDTNFDITTPVPPSCTRQFLEFSLFKIYLINHFQCYGTPVMIDDGTCARILFAIRETSSGIIILSVADPNKEERTAGLYYVVLNNEGEQIATTGIDLDDGFDTESVKHVHFYMKEWMLLFPQCKSEKKWISSSLDQPTYQSQIAKNRDVEKTRTLSKSVNIYVRLSNQIISVELTLKDTVETLKQKIQAQVDLQKQEYRITYVGKRLHDNMTLESYGIKMESTVVLRLIPRSGGNLNSEVVTIFVRTQDRRILNISISSDATVGTLRKMIAEAENIQLDGLMLYCRRPLEEDNLPLTSYGIASETTVGIGRTWEETHSEPVLIHAEILGDQVLDIKISLDETIGIFKQEVWAAVGYDKKMRVNADNPIVTFAGQRLSNRRTLESQGITAGATVILN